MTNTDNQSQSILYMDMAFAARAANHAVQKMKKGNL